MRICDIQNYSPNCPICNFLTDDETDKIYSGRHIEVALNPRWSPHLFRTALIPKRHLGESGKYGLELLGDCEREEYGLLRRATTDAIIRAARTTGNRLKIREEQLHIDYMERPSIHPSGDLIPQYYDPAKLRGFIFPRYLDAEMEPNSSNVKKVSVIVASFPKSESGRLTMPRLLREEMANVLKKHFKL